jgi:hypothetical protein
VKIFADESVDKQIVSRLRAQGHDVVYVAELDPGIDDETVLRSSHDSNALLVTADKDFGELVFRLVLRCYRALTPAARGGRGLASSLRFTSHGVCRTAAPPCARYASAASPSIAR